MASPEEGPIQGRIQGRNTTTTARRNSLKRPSLWSSENSQDSNGLFLQQQTLPASQESQQGK
jgi:hypothetical protein